MVVPMTFGERLKLVRGQESQGDFSRRLGVSLRAIGNYERNERTPDVSFASLVCTKTGVSPAWLLMGVGPMFEIQEPSQPAVCPPCPRPSSSADTEERLRSDMERYRMEWVRALDDNARLQEEIRGLTEENKRLFCENATLRAQVDASRGTAPSPQGKRPKHTRTEPALQDMDPLTDIEQYGLPPEHLNRR